MKNIEKKTQKKTKNVTHSPYLKDNEPRKSKNWKPFHRRNQTWVHIEDSIHPSQSRAFRQVIDLYTNVNYYYFFVSFCEKRNECKKDGQCLNGFDNCLSEDFEFTDLKIYARNMGDTELGFFAEGKERIKISLGSLKDLPDAPLSITSGTDTEKENSGLKHVKLEIAYTQPFNKDSNVFRRIDKYPESKFPSFIKTLIPPFFPQYKTIVSIPERIMPEFHVKVPKGMYIVNDSVKLYFSSYKDGKMNFGVEFAPKIMTSKADFRKKNNIYLGNEDFEKMRE